MKKAQPEVIVEIVRDPMFVPNNFKDFFEPGLKAMEKVMPTVDIYTKDQYFKILNWVVGFPPESGRGLIITLRNPDGSLCGYGGAYETFAPFSSSRNLHIFAVHTTTGCTAQTVQGFQRIIKYAKDNGYATVSGIGGRLNGFKKRFWQERIGFKLSYIGFIYHVK